MAKKAVVCLALLIIINALSACTPIKKPLDKRVHLTEYLLETEQNIRLESWDRAAKSLEESKKAWNIIKPILQVDIDHDYVNEIEDAFILLEVYLETGILSDSLVNIKLLQKNWSSIGEM